MKLTQTQVVALYEIADKLGKYEGDGAEGRVDLCGVWELFEPMNRMFERLRIQAERAGILLPLEVWETDIGEGLLGLEVADVYASAYDSVCMQGPGLDTYW